MRDLEIRQSLKAQMERVHDPDTLVLSELSLCQGRARVDLAVVNGELHGYEIKSERDTLARLASQSEIYNRVFDRVTIVISRGHAEKVANLIPSWWGIMTAVDAGESVALIETRDAGSNPSVDPFAQAQLLWRDEVLEALESRNLASGIRSKPRRTLWLKIAALLSPAEISVVVRDQLRRRFSVSKCA